jgi:DNA-binding response OmpR family regulator
MKRRILVVEDDEHLAHGLRLNLELEGYEPLVAPSAEEGLLYCRQGGIDLILLDVMLPGMDGFAFCRRIRKQGDRVPILYLTARDTADRL